MYTAKCIAVDDSHLCLGIIPSDVIQLTSNGQSKQRSVINAIQTYHPCDLMQCQSISLLHALLKRI